MRRLLSYLLLAAAGSVALSGCGGPAMAPVKGRVTFKGLPVKEAAVAFAPVPRSDEDKDPGKPATGFSDADGYFELSTFKPLDGAIVGKHKVTVSLDDTNPAKCNRQKELTFEVKPGANEMTIEMDPR
jgi:hypothetical protein